MKSGFNLARFRQASWTWAVLAVVFGTFLSIEAAPQTAAAASEAGRVMIVLDASGSMWAQIGGKTKIEIAREALAELLSGWDPKIEVGLMAYGHRRKADCADIEVLAPAGPVDVARLTKLVASIRPNGKTPLSAAVRQAAQSLRFDQQRATVILISDGIETCDADPCEVAAELERLGVAFTTHVIGFDVQRQDEGGLRCLANATGGRYFSANDAAALRESLRAAKTEVAAKPAPAPKPTPVTTPPPAASLNAPASVTAGMPLTVGWTGPNGKDDHVGFAAPGKMETGGNYVKTEAGNPLPMTAPERPGNYELLYMQGSPSRPLARRAIQITPAQATLEAVETITLGGTVEVKWTGPNGPGDYVTVVKPEATAREYGSYDYTSRGSPAKIRVPDKPGTYELRYITGSQHLMLARRTVIALPAETSIDAPESAPAGSRIKVQWTGPNNPGDYITVVTPQAGNTEHKSYFYTIRPIPEGGVIELPIQAGEYELRYITGQSNDVLARRTIAVTAVTAKLEAPAEAPAGSTVSIRWTGPNNAGDFITVVAPSAPKGGHTTYFYTAGRTSQTGGPLELPIVPGTYELRYVTGQGNETLARQAIRTLPLSVSLQAPETAPAGGSVKVTWTGPNYGGDYITIVEAAANKDAYTNYFYTKNKPPDQGSLKVPAKPGAYEIRYVAGQGKEILARRKIQVTPGS